MILKYFVPTLVKVRGHSQGKECAGSQRLLAFLRMGHGVSHPKDSSLSGSQGLCQAHPCSGSDLGNFDKHLFKIFMDVPRKSQNTKDTGNKPQSIHITYLLGHKGFQTVTSIDT